MKIKYCPDCGFSMDAYTDVCPKCGLGGLNQVFVSKEAYLRWEEQMLLPRKKQKNDATRVFAGTLHMLILHANGDLYAIGNNRNGCCGEEQRAELMQFTRIAEGVAHAAAGGNHTLYVSWNGKVTILGRSEYTERFSCDFPVKQVFAHPYYDVFLLEDLQGGLHFFGDRSKMDLTKGEMIPLRTLPPVRVRRKQGRYWGYHHVEYHSWASRYKWETSIIDGTTDCSRIPELQEAVRTDWYRELAREYGEGNLLIRLGDVVQSQTVSSRKIPREDNMVDYETIYDEFYEPTVYYINNHVYKPCPCRKNAEKISGNHFSGCWPRLTGVSDPDEAQKRKICDFIPAYTNERVYATLDEEGTVSFSSDLIRYNPRSVLKNIADLAVSPFSGSAFCGDLILVVTKEGKVFWGQRDEMEKAARLESSLDYLLKKGNLQPYLMEFTFSGE